MHYESTVLIDATPDAVWTVLADGPGWADWDSSVIRVDGDLVEGGKIALTSEVNPKRAFKLKVSEVRPGAHLELSQGMPFGLFTGRRTYDLVPEGAGTRFTMREEYTGPLAGLITKSIPDLQPSFDQFAAGLKAEVESG